MNECMCTCIAVGQAVVHAVSHPSIDGWPQKVLKYQLTPHTSRWPLEGILGGTPRELQKWSAAN